MKPSATDYHSATNQAPAACDISDLITDFKTERDNEKKLIRIKRVADSKELDRFAMDSREWRRYPDAED